MTKKQFADGWKHFCNRIDFGKSNLDAEAIRFMNEMPHAVGALFGKPEDKGPLDACRELVRFCESKDRLNQDDVCPTKAYELAKAAIKLCE
ncbi:hypothetical protein LCGC14_2422700 [marine sediment metagenome]|uniref:Uncharacterized protein n=1 Tax=marine sediment metagenome TaxID=412755 RepID=A0A0F9BPD2_9ZZZZ